MTDIGTDIQKNTTLFFISRELPQPQYEANFAKKGINAQATISSATVLRRANVGFSKHPDLTDAVAFQPHFGCMVINLDMMLIE